MITIIQTLESIGEAGASLIARYPVQTTELLALAVAVTYAFAGLSLARIVLRGGAR